MEGSRAEGAAKPHQGALLISQVHTSLPPALAVECVICASNTTGTGAK